MPVLLASLDHFEDSSLRLRMQLSHKTVLLTRVLGDTAIDRYATTV